MAEKWITWTKPSRSRTGEESTITRLVSEGTPKYFNSSRKATDEEIAEEIERRKQRERERQDKEAFEARPEYQCAIAVRNVLEWMTPADNPLDRLTVAEWEELRKKLTA